MNVMIRIVGVCSIADGLFLATNPRGWARWWGRWLGRTGESSVLPRLLALGELALGLYLVLRPAGVVKRHATEEHESFSSDAHRPIFRGKRSGLLFILLRLPVYLYRLGLGHLLGHRLLLLTHRGRVSGRTRQTVLEVARYDPRTGESVVGSGWGERADWFRNIQASPPIEVQTGGERYVPTYRVLGPDEAYDVIHDYERRLPVPLRPLVQLLGLDVAGSEEARRAHTASLLLIAFRPKNRGSA